MNPDLRLAPAALAAWAVAALAIHLPVAGQFAFAVAGAIGASLAVRAGRVALVVAGVVTASVALSAGIHSLTIVPCEGPASVQGRVAKDGVETALGAQAPARATVRVSAVACGGDSLAPAGGTIVLLGDVGEVARDSRIEANGRMMMLGRGSDAYALLLDAELTSVAPGRGVVGAVAQRRADFLALTSQLSPQGRGLVPGMTFGDDSALTDVLDHAMKRTSLSHLTAISGKYFARCVSANYPMVLNTKIPGQMPFLCFDTASVVGRPHLTMFALYWAEDAGGGGHFVTPTAAMHRGWSACLDAVVGTV